MDKNLSRVVIQYATGSHKNLRKALLRAPKEKVVDILTDLLTLYFNDKNSSTLRQYLLVSLSGYEMTGGKIGYNGYKRSGLGKSLYCEAKPKNVNTNDLKKRKLDGGGNFTDYTWKRLSKDKKSNPSMLVGGFLDGKLIYISQFPFKIKPFMSRLQEQLKRHFPNGYERGRFLRSASFGLKHYIEYSKLKTKIFVNRKELEERREFISGPLFKFLQEKISP